jgi:hypothetical protein
MVFIVPQEKHVEELEQVRHGCWHCEHVFTLVVRSL